MAVDVTISRLSLQELFKLRSEWGNNHIARLIGDDDDEVVLEIRGDAGKWDLTDSIPDQYAHLLSLAPALLDEVIRLRQS